MAIYNTNFYDNFITTDFTSDNFYDAIIFPKKRERDALFVSLSPSRRIKNERCAKVLKPGDASARLPS